MTARYTQLLEKSSTTPRLQAKPCPFTSSVPPMTGWLKPLKWPLDLFLAHIPGSCWILHSYTEKAMATHSSTLTWKIPWMEGPGRLQSMGLWRARHNWATSLSLFTFTHWSRKWQLTPVFLPGESQGQRSLVGCRRGGHTESDTTEAT